MNSKSEVLKIFQQRMELNLSKRTVEQYSYYVALFLDWSSNVPMRVTNDDFLEYNIFIRERSESFRHGSINAIKKYFELVLRKRVKNFADIRPAKVFKKPNYIPHEYFLECFSKVKNTKHRLIFILGYGLGLRSNETRSIKVQDVELDQYRIKINGKGKKQRHSYFDDYIYSTLISYFNEYKPTNYLIEGQNGKYSQTSIGNLMKHYFKGYTYHNLRHSFAQTILRNSGNLKLTADALGHNTTKTTEKFYVYGEVEKVMNYAPSFC